MSVPAGERRIVSVLVADVVGSTAIGEKLGPERSKFLFDELVALMREQVERFGGTVAQLTGDGVLALFGAPVAHDDDAERAVRAGLAVREVVGRYGRDLGPAYGVELGVRVAVNTGPVVVPQRDAPPDVLYNALGDAVNVAARLQPHGELVVGPETARQLAGRFQLEPLGDLELKGKAEPVAAFRVAEELERPAAAPRTPLVGREAELALLEGTLHELAAGNSAILVVTGEPGVGKSRLKTEARERFSGRVRFLEGHAASYASEIPYWPIRELLRDWLGLGVSDPEARVRLELRARLAGALGDQAGELYPFLARVLGVPLDTATDARLRELSRDSVQQQTFDALYRLACALAGEQPLCLVFEDLQWADESTIGTVEALLPVTDEQAVAIVLTYRTEGEHGGWDIAERARRRFRHRFLELDLQPLEQEAAFLLAEGAAGAELPASVAALLAERSGGNPFFLEEALRDLLERGVLRRANGRVELANGGDVSVPAAVEETLQARLDRLEPAAREVVSVAAVVGRHFGAPLLEQLVSPEQLRPALSELQRLDLVVEERRRPAAEYRFRHGLVQEVAYGRLVHARRRDLHRSVGEALEQLHRDSLDEVCGLLAHHFAEADDVGRAVDYLLRAADIARGMYAEEEARELYGRALGFMRRGGDTERARETLLKIALAHHLAFEFERAASAFEEAFTVTPQPPTTLEPTERLATVVPPLDALVPGHSYYEHGWDICRHLYRGLVTLGRNYEVVPDVAEAFTVSSDGTTYRFRIRDDARWSDGAPLTADDFAFTWAAMRDQNVVTAHLLDDVRSAEVVDARTLEVRLAEARNYFLHLLAQPAFFPWPRHVCERLGAWWHAHEPLVGNGPFVVADREKARLVLAASPTWRGARGNVRELDVEIAIDREGHPEEIEARWQAGYYDAATSGRAVEASNTIVETSPALRTFYLAFNADRPPLDDSRVRRAIAHAIDRGRWARASPLTGDPAGAGGFIPPTMPGHSHRVAPAYDPDRARALLAEAGYPDGGRLRELAFAEVESFPAREIGEQLAEIGIRVRPVPGDVLRYWDVIDDQQVDGFVWGWSADAPDPVGMIPSFLDSAQRVYRDSRVAHPLARAQSARNQKDRLTAFREAERVWLGEQAAIVPLKYGRNSTLTRPWVEGLWQNAVLTSTFAEVVVRPELRSAARSA